MDVSGCNGRALDRVTKQNHRPSRQKLSQKCQKIVFSAPPDNFWTFSGILSTFCRHSLLLGCPTICPLQVWGIFYFFSRLGVGERIGGGVRGRGFLLKVLGGWGRKGPTRGGGGGGQEGLWCGWGCEEGGNYFSRVEVPAKYTYVMRTCTHGCSRH